MVAAKERSVASFSSQVRGTSGIESLVPGKTVPQRGIIGRVFSSMWYIIGRVAYTISPKTVPII